MLQIAWDHGVVPYKRIAHLIRIDTPGNPMAKQVEYILGGKSK
jgi:hypothetical protein